jgi:ribosomal protein L31E
MPAISLKKGDITEVKKMRDYSKDPSFKKKAENAVSFLKKHALPKAFKKKEK